jgi:TPR repeat protein
MNPFCISRIARVILGQATLTAVLCVTLGGLSPLEARSVSAPEDRLMSQQQAQLQLDHQVSDLLEPLQRRSPHHEYPTEGQATLWFQASEFTKAFPVLQHDAAMGSHRAELEVGYMYQYGLGVPKDERKAALWYYIASDPTPDDATALTRGLDAYFALDGYTRDDATAAQWFQMAAELSNDPY